MLDAGAYISYAQNMYYVKDFILLNKKLAMFATYIQYIQGGKKKFMMWSREKCLWNSKIFFYGVFLSINSHLLKKLELSKLFRKKVIGL